MVTEKEKIVFFEEIAPASYPIARDYLGKGFTVYYFKIEDTCKSRLKTGIHSATEKLIDASEIRFDFGQVNAKASLHAHEKVDYIFDKYFSSTPSLKTMEKLLETSKIKDMYQYRLLRKLQDIYLIEIKINEIARDRPAEIHFCPADNFEIHSDESSLLPKHIRVIKNNTLRTRVKNSLTRVKKLILLLSLCYLFLKKVKGISRRKIAQKFKVGVSVSFPKDIFSMNYYLMETLLVDDKELPKDEVLFIDERGQRTGDTSYTGSAPPNSKDYQKRGYHYTNLFDVRETISADTFWQKIVRRFSLAWLKTMLFSLWEQPLIVDTNIVILLDYLIWNIFTDNYQIDNYVKIQLPDSLSRIQILSRNNAKTWYIFPDNTSHDHYLDWDTNLKNQTLFSFIDYDNIVVYGDTVEKFFRKHRNNPHRYIKSGVLYSQIVRELEEGKLKSPISDIIQGKNLPEKRIGVFDTSYVDWGPYTIRDGVDFARDMLRLLDDFPDVGILFKAIKWPGWAEELDRAYDELKNHERCLLFYMWNKEGISAVEVIAESDLVISAPYTSPSAEALGAKKKAIYYDFTAHHIGDRYYYNRFPNFVAHSYDELKKLTHYWLYEATNNDFESFLNTYIKDEIDPYLDGKALTRLRKLLRE